MTRKGLNGYDSHFEKIEVWQVEVILLLYFAARKVLTG